MSRASALPILFFFLPILAGAQTTPAPADPAAHLDQEFAAGEAAVASKDWTAALSHLEAAAAADPESQRYASEYRMAVIAAAAKAGLGPGAYDRAIAFFEKQAGLHPKSPNTLLNWGYAYVDKIPTAGSITQVILANTALGLFTRTLDLQRSWLALYTRGNSYLYWPKVFGRTPLGVADLEAAVAMSRRGSPRPYHVRAYVALGDGYWKLDQLEKARATWSEGARLFPESAPLKLRLAKQGDELKELIEGDLDPSKRVDTNLQPIWADRP